MRVYPTVRYTLHGELRRKSLGIYRNARGVVGGEVSYSDARAEAERIISEARHGRDPFIGVALLRNADISTFEGLASVSGSRAEGTRAERGHACRHHADHSQGAHTDVGTPGPELDPATGDSALGQAHRGREGAQEGGALPRQPSRRLHGDDPLVGGAPRDPPIHALPRLGEAVRRAAEDTDLQQRRTPSPHCCARAGTQANRCGVAHAVLHRESPPRDAQDAVVLDRLREEILGPSGKRHEEQASPPRAPRPARDRDPRDRQGLGSELSIRISRTAATKAAPSTRSSGRERHLPVSIS